MTASFTAATAMGYTPDRARMWNAAIAGSRNGTFLFDRNYMEHHADRFIDQSVCVLLDSEMSAAFPASRHDRTAISHGGLTYGGLVYGDRKSGASRVMEALELVCKHLASAGLSKLIYKAVPHIYHRQPSEEDLYALFRIGASLVRRDISSAIPPYAAAKLRKGRKAMVQRGRAAQLLQIRQSIEWEQFHRLLAGRLESKYNVAPVHSAAELKLLSDRFPGNVILTSAFLHETMIGGCLSFETERVVHAQYLAADDEGRDSGAMDLLVYGLIEKAVAAGKWFDFGISTTDGGRSLNASLVDYKEGFGAHGVVHDHYEIAL